MVIAGYILAIFIGISLGLVGSGGSVLAVPILVYVVGIPPSLATTYSLFVVGVSAFFGTVKASRDKLLAYKIAVVFGIPSIIAIFVMRKYILPAVPDELFTVGKFLITKDLLIMIAFAILMIFASFSMIWQKVTDGEGKDSLDYVQIFLRGILIGALTGFVGVGGGFLIIPSLVFLTKLPMKKAVVTSLALISINSFIGFFSGLQGVVIDWQFLLTFSGFAVLGIFVGMFLTKFVSDNKLKPAFGWFILVMGIYIIIKELLFKH